MKLIKPVKLTDAMLVSSTIAETDYAAWSAATNYAAAQRCIKAHCIWESKVGSNLNNDPTTGDGSKWIKVGPTNRWAPFDDKIGTTAVATGSMNYVLRPGAIDAIAVLDSDAETVEVVMTVSGSEVYRQTRSFNVGGKAIDSYYRWFFEPIGTRSRVTFEGLPLYANPDVSITITGRSGAGAVHVGTLSIGRMTPIGLTEAGVDIDTVNFSKIVIDDFGNRSIAKRGFSKRVTSRALIPTTQADRIEKLLTDLKDEVVVYIVEDGLDSLIILGFCAVFSTQLAEGIGGSSFLNTTVESITSSL